MRTPSNEIGHDMLDIYVLHLNSLCALDLRTKLGHYCEPSKISCVLRMTEQKLSTQK